MSTNTIPRKAVIAFDGHGQLELWQAVGIGEDIKAPTEITFEWYNDAGEACRVTFRNTDCPSDAERGYMA